MAIASQDEKTMVILKRICHRKEKRVGVMGKMAKSVRYTNRQTYRMS